MPTAVNEQLLTAREACLETLDRIRAHLPEVPLEEVEQDGSEAIAAIRAKAGPEDPQKKTES